MKRIEFLKKAGLGLITTSALMACTKEDLTGGITDEPTNTPGSTNGESADNCSVTNPETAGPFPTKNPSDLQMQDIRSDRTGVQMDITLTVVNATNGCAFLPDAIVDIWHCDREGYYSEYGGTGMQSVNLTNVHFLRGRQVTDREGQVRFTSIFPGWYSGRAPHIHVHIYNASSKSLLVTQIAFPKTVCDHVYTTATNLYTKGTQDTTNERDNVFGDGYANELGSIAGSIDEGYALIHTIVVSA